LLACPVFIQNDANCLAVSEAVDGAGAGKQVVFAAILGTGVGGGVALNGKALTGHNAIAGEWGHNPLPWQNHDELNTAPCWCGQTGCIETWVSGVGFANDHQRITKQTHRAAPDIIAAMRTGDEAALAGFDRYCDRLARALAHMCNLLDPDVIVLGGGMSNVPELYTRLPELVKRHVFSDVFTTPIASAKHGDSSGVRGAAWLTRSPENPTP
jgi:fructokinase